MMNMLAVALVWLEFLMLLQVRAYLSQSEVQMTYDLLPNHVSHNSQGKLAYLEC